MCSRGSHPVITELHPCAKDWQIRPQNINLCNLSAQPRHNGRGDQPGHWRTGTELPFPLLANQCLDNDPITMHCSRTGKKSLQQRVALRTSYTLNSKTGSLVAEPGKVEGGRGEIWGWACTHRIGPKKIHFSGSGKECRISCRRIRDWQVKRNYTFPLGSQPLEWYQQFLS